MSDDLTHDLITVVVDAAARSPRSQQTVIGPSEIGAPCDRQLAYKLTDTESTWTHADPWAAIVGTAAHTWLAGAFVAANHALGEARWLVEQRVYPHPGYPGSCDLYDTHTETAIDHKVVGVTTMRAAKSDGPSAQYRIQAQLYALGWENLGRRPREVAIAYFPRSGFLSDLFVYREAYSRGLATDALARLATVSAAALALHVDTDPHAALLIPSTPGDYCRFCPYKTMRPGDGGCPDERKPEKSHPRGRVPGLTL